MLELIGRGSETSWNTILNYCWFELSMFELTRRGRAIMGHSSCFFFGGETSWNCFAILTVASLKFEVTIKARVIA
jgi:hypothetical protein